MITRSPLKCALALMLPLVCVAALAAGNTSWKLEVLHSFNVGPGGYNPYAGLVEHTPGVFWGTAAHGGGAAWEGDGTVFKFTPGNAPVVMHAFGGRDGSSPKAELLTVGRNLYGTTASGGVNGSGTIYRISTLGFSVMHHLNASEGQYPEGPLIRATNGRFYGTTPYGGAHGLGSVFQMEASGAITVLHHFMGGDDGVNPTRPLVQHANGLLYGTTPLGGGSGFSGTVFKITTWGTYEVLHRFTQWGNYDAYGCQPGAGLTLAPDGGLVGSTSNCGQGPDSSSWAGTLFKIKPEGPLTLWHTFVQGVSGKTPVGEMVLHSDGMFYGTTRDWDTHNGCGNIFAKRLDGAFGNRHVFDADQGEGCKPRGALVSAKDGALYGTTSAGGAYGLGTIFRLRLVTTYPDH